MTTMKISCFKDLPASLPLSVFYFGGALAIVSGLYPAAAADEVRIERVSATCEDGQNERICSFSVTLRHNDEGWHHYANQWEVVSGERVLATRTLGHPHVDEQPFTRSLNGVKVPFEVTEVRVRAMDTQHGMSPHEYRYRLP